uniref:Uncharacterized protein n=1 Tax=Romanomermis culicivorax TaxID=13658 RepID=A0A915JEY2_ROMCU
MATIPAPANAPNRNRAATPTLMPCGLEAKFWPSSVKHSTLKPNFLSSVPMVIIIVQDTDQDRDKDRKIKKIKIKKIYHIKNLKDKDEDER